MTVILSLLVMQGIMSPAFAQNQLNDHHRNKEECLLDVWEWTNPTEQEKQFDITHDADLHGYRFSCFTGVAATEINTILILIKNALLLNDKKTIADHSSYPFRYWVETEELTEYGKIQPKVAMTKEELIENYDEIFRTKVKNFFACGNIDKITSNGDGTVGLASNLILIGKGPDNQNEYIADFQKYPMRLGGVGPLMERHDRWFNEHCQ